MSSKIKDIVNSSPNSQGANSELDDSFQQLQTMPYDPENAERLKNLPTPEQKQQQLTFENLAKLSTEEYLKRWKKLNPFYVTHVTRQGVRDHNAMFYHSAGLGELHDGFKTTIADGKQLRTPSEIEFGITADFTEQDVANFLEKYLHDNPDIAEYTPQEILNQLPQNSTMAAADPWADKMAIHFAQHTVLNDYYGGEQGNEIFYVFPTDVVASQCQYGGHMHPNLTTASVSSNRKWNDLFAWPKNSTIPLDAGLVFIPENQMVDPATGSKYATIEKEHNGHVTREVIKDEARIARFTEWLQQATLETPEIAAALDDDFTLVEAKLREIGFPDDNVKMFSGIAEQGSLQHFIEQKNFGELWMIPEEQAATMSDAEKTDWSIRYFLQNQHADLKLADNPIPAREYWERYFTEHPDQRPAHVLYYTGGPTRAVNDLLRENGIMERANYSPGDPDFQQNMTGPGDSVERDGEFLGFEKNFISDGSQDIAMQQAHQRFNEIALKILQNRRA